MFCLIFRSAELRNFTASLTIHFKQQRMASFSVKFKVVIFFKRIFMRLPVAIPDYIFVTSNNLKPIHYYEKNI